MHTGQGADSCVSPRCGTESLSRKLEQSAALCRTHIFWDQLDRCFRKLLRILTFSPFTQRLMFGTQTSALPFSSKAARVSHGPDEIQEYAFVIVFQIGQVVGEAGEVVADANLKGLADATINCGQRSAAVLI